jgi:hypothetical protein
MVTTSWLAVWGIIRQELPLLACGVMFTLEV